MHTRESFENEGAAFCGVPPDASAHAPPDAVGGDTLHESVGKSVSGSARSVHVGHAEVVEVGSVVHAAPAPQSSVDAPAHVAPLAVHAHATQLAAANVSDSNVSVAFGKLEGHAPVRASA